MELFVIVLAGKPELHEAPSTAYAAVRLATAGFKRICFVPNPREADEALCGANPAENLQIFLTAYQHLADGCNGFLIVCGDLPHLNAMDLEPVATQAAAGNTTSVALYHATRSEIASYLTQMPEAPQRVGTCVRLRHGSKEDWYKFAGVFFVSTPEHLAQIRRVLGPMYANRKKPIKLLRGLVRPKMLVRFVLSQLFRNVAPLSVDDFEYLVRVEFGCTATCYPVSPSLVIDED